MSPSLTAHLAAINSGQVERTNLIGIRKQVSAMERGRTWGGSWRDKMPEPDDVWEVEEALSRNEPRVSTEIAAAGMKQLGDKRYAKRFTPAEREIFDNLDVFRLVGFQRAGHRGMTIVPVFRAVAANGDSFLFVNVPWQSAFSDSSLTSGPSVVQEGEF